MANAITSETLAQAVRTRRKSFDLTQTQLADISGVSPRFVYDLEAGKKSVSLDKVLAVTGALGIALIAEVAARG